MSRVFVSYRRVQPDEELAEALAGHLQRNGHAVFMDRGIGVGEDWVATIERELREADAFIVLLSGDSIASDMVRREVAEAYELNRQRGGRPKILPVRVAFDGQLPYDLASFLHRPQATSWQPGMSPATLGDQLVAALTRSEAPHITDNPEIRYSGNEALYAATEAVGVPLPAADPRLVAALDTGSLQVDSAFYVRRDSDNIAEACLAHKTPTTIVKGPRQLGKSSLLARMHATAQTIGRKSWYRDFQYIDSSKLRDLDTLSPFLAREMARAFGASTPPREVWDDEVGPIGNLTNYLEDVILPAAVEPVQIVFDEAERLFDYPYRDEFFAMIRGWHNRRAVNPKFTKLMVVIGHATTPALWIQDLNQSPFNVGYPIHLRAFGPVEVTELARRHGVVLTVNDVARIVALLGGHPYLTRLGLHVLATKRCSVEALIASAGDQGGHFADHLRSVTWMLNKAPELRASLRGIVHGNGCEDEIHFQRLWASGLIHGESRGEARVSCGVYEQYFQRHL